MTEVYADVIGTSHVTVAERSGAVVGVLVLSVGDEGFTIQRRRRPFPSPDKELDEPSKIRRNRGPSCWVDSVALFTHEQMTENQALYAADRVCRVRHRRSQGDFSLVYMRKALG